MFKRKPKVYDDDPILDKLIENADKIEVIERVECGNYIFYIWDLQIQTWWWISAHVEVDGIKLTVNDEKAEMFFNLVMGAWKLQHKQEIENKRKKIYKTLGL